MRPPELIPDDENILPDDQDAGDCIPPQFMQENDVILCKDEESVDRIERNCKNPFSVISLFDETPAMLQFNKRSYKASVSVGLMANMVHPVISVFDKGAGSNLIREKFFEAEWFKAIQANNRPSLKKCFIFQFCYHTIRGVMSPKRLGTFACLLFHWTVIRHVQG